MVLLQVSIPILFEHTVMQKQNDSGIDVIRKGVGIFFEAENIAKFYKLQQLRYQHFIYLYTNNIHIIAHLYLFEHR